jgi:uncharacterized protein (DUF1800 family)
MNENETQPLVPAPVPAERQVRQAPPKQRGIRLSRRQLLIGAGVVGVGAAAITSGILYERGALPFASAGKPMPAPASQIAHLLRRAGFGARASEIQTYSALGLQGAIDRLLNPQGVSDDLDSRLNSLNLDLTSIPDEQRWWLLRMIYSQRPLQEKMTLFWHGVLTSSYTKVGGKSGYGYMITQNNFLRDHCFDTYDNILLGITSDPAMMWWLDLRLSQKNLPNENYARELMELFTLGINGGYTQDDVHNAALALTGWRLPRSSDAAVYNPAQHNDSQKTLLGHSGDLDYHDVIRIVAAHPATGPHICTRIFSFFVHANPSSAELQPMVDAYNNSGHNMGAVMRALFNSPAFFAASSYRARIKSPAEFLVGAVRQLEIETNGQALSNVLTLMGQTIFNPPNVAGWPGDNDSTSWLNTGTWLTRLNLINALLEVASPDGSSGTVQQTLSNAGAKTPEQAVDYFTNLLIDGQISSDRRQMLLDAMGSSVSADGLRAMLYLLMTGPEYQLN